MYWVQVRKWWLPMSVIAQAFGSTPLPRHKLDLRRKRRRCPFQDSTQSQWLLPSQSKRMPSSFPQLFYICSHPNQLPKFPNRALSPPEVKSPFLAGHNQASSPIIWGSQKALFCDRNFPTQVPFFFFSIKGLNISCRYNSFRSIVITNYWLRCSLVNLIPCQGSYWSAISRTIRVYWCPGRLEPHLTQVISHWHFEIFSEHDIEVAGKR